MINVWRNVSSPLKWTVIKTAIPLFHSSFLKSWFCNPITNGWSIGRNWWATLDIRNFSNSFFLIVPGRILWLNALLLIIFNYLLICVYVCYFTFSLQCKDILFFELLSLVMNVFLHILVLLLDILKTLFNVQLSKQ